MLALRRAVRGDRKVCRFLVTGLLTAHRPPPSFSSEVTDFLSHKEFDMTRPKATARASSASPAKRASVVRKTAKQSPVFTSTTDETLIDPLLAPTPPLRKPYFRIPDQVTMSRQHYNVRRAEDVVGCAVPKLRLSGRWLEQCGFAVGDALRVTVGRGMLLISRVAPAIPAARPRRR